MGARRPRGFAEIVCWTVFVAGCRFGYEPIGLASVGPDGASGSADGGIPSSGGNGGGAPSSSGAPSTSGASSSSGAPSSGAPNGGGGAPVEPPRCTAPVSPITDFCASLPKLTGAVVLDGEIECGLTPIEVEPQGWPNDPAQLDAKARLAVAWDENGLYFYLDVRDPSPISAAAADPAWMGDSVELYVDTDATYANPPGYDAVGTRQISIGRTNSDGTGLRGQLDAALVTGFPVDWPPEGVKVQSTDAGYVVEAYIPGSVLGTPDWKLTAGAHVGMDIGVNVSFPDPQTTGTQGHRWSQYFYHQDPAPAGEPFRNVAGFCTPVLVE